MAKQNNNQPSAEMNETLSKYEAMFSKHKNAIIAALVCVVLLIAGVILYRNFVVEPRKEKAATMLGKMEQLFQQQQYEQALKGSGADAPGFVQIAKDFGSTDAGNLANYYAGLCYAKMEKWQEAAGYLEKFDTKDDLFISPESQMALGDCYANLKEYDKAVSSFRKAAKMADKAAADGRGNTISPNALMKAAKILLEQKKNSDALDIFKEIKEKYVNSPVSMEIDKYIELVSE